MCVRSPGTGITAGYGSPHGRWELYLGPLEEAIAPAPAWLYTERHFEGTHLPCFHTLPQDHDHDHTCVRQHSPLSYIPRLDFSMSGVTFLCQMKGMTDGGDRKGTFSSRKAPQNMSFDCQSSSCNVGRRIL